MIFEYATDTATLAAPTGSNKKGVMQYGTAVSTPVRLELKSNLFITDDGSQAQGDGKVYIPGTASPQIGSKMVVTGGGTYRIALLNTRRDLEGNVFYSATIQELKGAG